MKKRKIRIALRIMFDDPEEDIKHFVKSSLDWKYRGGGETTSFDLNTSFPESMGYYYINFGFYIPMTPDFSIEEVLNEEKILGYSGD